MGFLYNQNKRPRGFAPRGPLPDCRFSFRPGSRIAEIFFFDREKQQGEYNVPQGGGVAQLGEHHVRNVGVEGSIPFSSTIFVFPFRSSLFLIGRVMITLSGFLSGANHLPRLQRRIRPTYGNGDRLPHPRRKRFASSLDLRNTRKPSLALSPDAASGTYPSMSPRVESWG
jgi:hypothetical protein